MYVTIVTALNESSMITAMMTMTSEISAAAMLTSCYFRLSVTQKYRGVGKGLLIFDGDLWLGGSGWGVKDVKV